MYDKINSLKGVEGEIKMTVVQNSSTVNASDTKKAAKEDLDEDLYTEVERVGTLLRIDNIVCEAYGFNEPIVKEYAKTIKEFGESLNNYNVYNILIPTHVEFALPSKYENSV